MLLGECRRWCGGKEESEQRERSLAHRLLRARQHGILSEEFVQELAEIRRRELGDLEEVTTPPDRFDAFADEAENRLEQDLLMLRNGIRTRAMKSRTNMYRAYMNDPDMQMLEVVQRYKAVLTEAEAVPSNLAPYVPGDAIPGDALREWASLPTLCGPLVCQLCVAHFVCEADFTVHKKQEHGGDKAYRKRVL